MKKIVAVISLSLLLCAGAAYGQNPASNKAFFASNPEGIKLAAVSGEGWSAPITLFSIPAAVNDVQWRRRFGHPVHGGGAVDL